MTEDHGEGLTASGHRAPRYEDLPLNPSVDGRDSWGVFGAGDDLGTLNWLSPAGMLRAVSAVQAGERYNLSLPLDYLDAEHAQPTASDLTGKPARPPRDRRLRHTIYHITRTVQDDFIDNFYLQRTTQIDALRHVATRDGRFYNGVDADSAGTAGERLGIGAVARHTIVGRGVLLDLAPGGGADTPGNAPIPIGVPEIAGALEQQDCQLLPGDILLLRTGYLAWHRELSIHERSAAGAVGTSSPGLMADEDLGRYLWDQQVAVVAADNPGLEVMPGRPGAFLHRHLIAGLGMTLGEWFDLDALAAACRLDHRYECLVLIGVLNLARGVGSPACAVALR